ncbi:hypothetical protein QQS21_005077 [Conoideocrella luteorostrata]|uniref:N-acetyltransferase domain-containing protein n=1 Tax=Conoideocrella luteorostrata TaxID=1105319 RepID=A0AAJ0CUD9_9HYPO|nr:hypothetical protein QQS21_005077 [Conoideocrella luteorostrata]
MDYLPTSPDGLTIRKALPSDIPQIQHMILTAFTKYIPRIGKPPAPMTANYHRLLTSHDIFTLQPDTSPHGSPNHVVGSIVLRADMDSKVMHINNLVVDPEAQGRGFGKVLLKYAEDWAAVKACTVMALYTNVKMFENFGLYARLGYEEVDRKEEDGYERVYFRKELREAEV